MATDTTEQFDPYRKWLGIPPKDQPAHHYRLLGIAAFESDPDVVQNAADRQMAHVRNFQRGKNAAESQKILNELAAAKVCLLTEAKKSDYDKQLREQLRAKKAAATAARAATPVAGAPIPVAAVPEPPVAEAIPTAVAEAPAQPGFSNSPKISARKPSVHRRRRKNSVLPIGIAVVCLGVLAVGGIVAMSQLGDKKDKSSSKESELDKPTKKDSKKNNPAPKQPDRQSPKRGTDTPKRPDSQTRTDTDKPFTSPLTNLKPDSNTQTTAERTKQLKFALEKLRGALASRDETTAVTHLANADELKQTAVESAEVESLRQLATYLRGFWSGVTGGIKEFEESMSFEFQGRSYEFVSKDSGTLTYKVDGVETSAPVRKLAPFDAVAIAFLDLDKDNTFDNFYVVTFHAIDNQGDIEKQRSVAREMLLEAVKDGNRNEMLIAELDLKDVVPGTTPDTPTTPVKPTPGDTDKSPPNDSLAPVPSAEELRAAKVAMRSKLGSKLRVARTLDAKAQLATELSEQAGDEPELVLKYELWMQARLLAIEARQLELSMTVTDSMAEVFEIDALSQKQEALEELVAKPDVDVAAISQTAGQLFQQAVSESKFEVARRLGETRKRAAKRTGQIDLVKQIDEELSELDQKRKSGEPDESPKDQPDS
jgi:hypothetical protein